MKNYTIRPYQTTDFAEWNAFVGKSKNATFLFHRDFMDYHADRFADFSLIILDEEKWVAIMPANKKGSELFSHQGLTYGGLVFGEKIKLSIAIGIFKSILMFLDENGIQKLQVKMLPTMYQNKPSDELAYALFLTEASLVRRDTLSVLDMSKPFSFSKDRQKCAKRGLKNGLKIKEESNFRLFWESILIPNLNHKHEVKPVHTFEEMERLHQKFPENIRHFNVYHDEKIVAGTTVFVTENVVHPQYISGQANKNELGSLDYLYDYLIHDIFKDKHFFDFGISNEQQGKKLNEGLVFWKESFGTGTMIQDFYEVNTINYKLLENVLI